MDVEPVNILGRRTLAALPERTLDRAQLLLARLLFLGAALLFDDLDELRSSALQRLAQRRIRRVVDEAERVPGVRLTNGASTWPCTQRKVHGGWASSSSRPKVLDHARAAPEQCHAIAVGWLAEINSAYMSPMLVRSAGS